MDFLSTRPSVFELLAEWRMRTLLEPAFTYALTAYCQRYPRYLILHRYRIGLYSFFEFLIEQYYQREWNSSSTEHTFGLKRINNDFKKSMIGIVFLPMIKRYFDDIYQSLLFRNTRIFGSLFQQDATGWERFKQILQEEFVYLYPYLNILLGLSRFLYSIAYIHGLTKYTSPWLMLCKIEIARLSAKDYKRAADKDQARFKSLMTQGISPRILLYYVLKFLRYLLPFSLVTYRFIEWWYSQELHKKSMVGPIPPPPQRRGKQGGRYCLLCKQQRTNPAMTPSGYLFCYVCLFQYIEEHGRCPITFDKLVTDDIQKIYY